MDEYQRFAIYVAPEPGALARFAAAWLGWDAAGGCAVPHPEVPGLPREIADLTVTPRKYGFHATIKPPFRLVEGVDGPALHRAMTALAARLAPVRLDGLRVARLGGFVALVPLGDTGPLVALAATVVAELDPFRAALTRDDLTRRMATPLSPAQRDLLERWGYPYVMEEFSFHMTLTGNLPEAEAETVCRVLQDVVGPLIPVPSDIGSLCLFGEAADGRFHLLHRYTLSC